MSVQPPPILVESKASRTRDQQVESHLREPPIGPEIGHVRRPAGVFLIVAFLACLVAVPVVQVACELGGWFDKTTNGNIIRDRHVQVLDIATKLKDVKLFAKDTPDQKTLLKHIQGYEKALEDRCVLSEIAQPLVQWTQLVLAHQGNEKVMVGKNRWLFFRPSVAFVTGTGFLDIQAAQPNGETSRTTEVLPIIIHFQEQLKERGIELVLAPVPVKPSIYPDQLPARYDLSLGPPVNHSLAEFYRRLSDNGVTVIDLIPKLWQARAQGTLWLAHDSHWTPRGMQVYVKALADELKNRYDFLRAPAQAFSTQPAEVSNYGDLFNMLKLPKSSDFFTKTTLQIQQVRNAQGQFTDRDEESPVVLLGDS